MYNLSERLAILKGLGVVGIKVLQVPNERPGPGAKTNGLNLAANNKSGFLDEFNSRQKISFNLMAEIERRDNLYVVWAEGRDREIRPLGDQTPADSTALFAKRIPTDITMTSEYVTKNTPKIGNGIWVISTANGQLQMWEVAIVTFLKAGKSRYYLSLQKVYAAEMFQATVEEWDDPIYIPEEQFPNYMDWYSLRFFICRVADKSALKPMAEHKLEAKEPVALADGQAEVIWFNQAKGFGFARVPNEEPNPNLHWSEVRDQEFPAFQPGQIIKYSNLNRTPKGVQLMGVTE